MDLLLLQFKGRLLRMQNEITGLVESLARFPKMEKLKYWLAIWKNEQKENIGRSFILKYFLKNFFTWWQ